MLPSIVIPTKNRAHLVTRAIESALNQTVKCEVVVFDGGSTDGTESACLGYGDRIKYFRLPVDPGYMASWYVAASLAMGDVMHWGLDDDWIEPAYMERCLSMLHDDVGVVFTQATIHFTDGRTALNWNCGVTQFYDSKEIETHMLKMEMTISPACWVARRNDVLDNLVVGKLPFAKYRMGANEVFMTMSLLKRYPRVGYISDPLANFGAQEDASTIEALNAGGEKLEKFLDEYRQVKRSYMMLKEGL